MAGLVASGLAGASLSFCGRSARTRRTVRHLHIETTRNLAESCFPVCCMADGPTFTPGRSAVHFSAHKQNQVISRFCFAFERRTVRRSPVDGLQFISKSHTETTCFWSSICLCTADGPRYSTGQSAVHFWTNTQNQTFSRTRLEFHRRTVRASRADCPWLL